MILRQGITVCLIAVCLLAAGCSKSKDKEEFDVHKMAKDVESWDIWLAEVDFSSDEVRFGDVTNITNRPGYDNQPQFLQSGTGVLYTSIRDEYQSEIWLYDLASATHAQLTRTDELEFSPMPMPSGDGFSTVRVEEDGAQRLWHFSMDGSSSQVILPDVDKVGYYSWVDANRVAMFVIEEKFSLQIGWVNYDEAHSVADGVGRSFSRSPVADEIVFSRWPAKFHELSEEEWGKAMKAGDWQLEMLRMDIEEWKEQPLTMGRTGSSDFTWTPQGDLLMAEGLRLYRYVMAEDNWELIADLEGRVDGSTIQRLVVSPNGKLLAMTVSEPEPESAQKE